jgi:hypothetical protein
MHIAASLIVSACIDPNHCLLPFKPRVRDVSQHETNPHRSLLIHVLGQVSCRPRVLLGSFSMIDRLLDV